MLNELGLSLDQGQLIPNDLTPTKKS